MPDDIIEAVPDFGAALIIFFEGYYIMLFYRIMTDSQVGV